MPRTLVCFLVMIGLAAGGAVVLSQHQAAGENARSPGRAPAAAPSDGGATPVVAGTAPGTCMAYDPAQGGRRQTVFVDPGHGNVDIGTSGVTSDGATVYEKNLTLAVGLDLRNLLRAAGYRVVMSRVNDHLLIAPRAGEVSNRALTLTGEHDDTAARIACANAAHADLLLSIHFNAFSDPTVNGAETLYDSVREFGAANRKLATIVQSAIISTLRGAGWAVPDRGILDDSVAGTPSLSQAAAEYGHLLILGPAATGWLDHPSAMPGVLVEPLFLSHPAEADVAASNEGQQAIARGLASAVSTHFSTSKPAS